MGEKLKYGGKIKVWGRYESMGEILKCGGDIKVWGRY